MGTAALGLHGMAAGHGRTAQEVQAGASVAGVLEWPQWTDGQRHLCLALRRGTARCGALGPAHECRVRFAAFQGGGPCLQSSPLTQPPAGPSCPAPHLEGAALVHELGLAGLQERVLANHALASDLVGQTGRSTGKDRKSGQQQNRKKTSPGLHCKPDAAPYRYYHATTGGYLS